MTALDDAESIIGAIRTIDAQATIDAIVAEFAGFARDYGVTSVVMGHLRNAAMVAEDPDRWMIGATWPADWYSIWRRRHLILHDPIALCAWRVSCSFSWREAYRHGSPEGKSILDESRNFGFCEGVAIPVRTFSGRAGCVSLGAERIDLAPADLAGLELVAVHAFVKMEEIFGAHRAASRAVLTHRETEILHFAAAGKTNWEISEILSISEYTVRDHFKSIARKLNCANRAHAVAIAIERNLIMP